MSQQGSTPSNQGGSKQPDGKGRSPNPSQSDPGTPGAPRKLDPNRPGQQDPNRADSKKTSTGNPNTGSPGVGNPSTGAPSPSNRPNPQASANAPYPTDKSAASNDLIAEEEEEEEEQEEEQ